MPEFLKTYKITKDWVDYNNHLNMAYYVLIFDKAWEVMLEKFQMGETSAKKNFPLSCISLLLKDVTDVPTLL